MSSEEVGITRQRRPWPRLLLITGLLCLVGLTAVWAQSASESEKEGRARGEGLVLARCGICHSTDLITQQRLPQDKWEATVAKMRHWGAELTDQEAELLVAYLSGRYNPATPDVLPPDSEPATPYRVGEVPPDAADAAPRPAGNARRGHQLFSNSCQACHGERASGGAGPKLSGNPILAEEDRFWDTVLHGRNAMPAWGSVLKVQEIADIHAWLRSIAE